MYEKRSAAHHQALKAILLPLHWSVSMTGRLVSRENKKSALVDYVIYSDGSRLFVPHNQVLIVISVNKPSRLFFLGKIVEARRKRVHVLNFLHDPA